MKLEEKIKIQLYLEEGFSIKKIALLLFKTVSTISREILKYRFVKRNNKVFELNKKIDIEILNEHPCKLLKISPYVCNGCPRYTNNHCSYHFVVYDGNKAHSESLAIKSKANQKKVNLELVNNINELIEKGQPISHLYQILKEKYNENIISKTTIYNWIKDGIIKYKKRKIKRNKSNNTTEKIKNINRVELLKGKEYSDFLEYISNPKNEFKQIVEIDLVCGKQGTNGYILTMFIPKLQFLMAYKLNNKTPQEVIRVFDYIESKIGYTPFKRLFGCLLTDQGSEFLKFNEICRSKKTNRRRTKIFYCEPASPHQKPNIENIHLILRRVYPKGISLENVTQEDLYEVVSNINSLKKVKYNGKTPNDMFIEHFNISLLKKLSLRVYSSEDVVLLPYNNF